MWLSGEHNTWKMVKFGFFPVGLGNRLTFKYTRAFEGEIIVFS
jgi:hypothetical protein